MIKDWVEAIGKDPTRAMEWPLWLVQLFGGLWVLGPYFQPMDAPNGNLAAAGDIVALKIYGIVLVSIGLAGIVGLIQRGKWYPVCYRLRRAASFASFFLFSYFVILRILVEGVGNLAWTTFFLNACLAAVIHLRLKWEHER